MWFWCAQFCAQFFYVHKKKKFVHGVHIWFFSNFIHWSEPHFVKSKHIKDPEDFDKEREEREKRKFQRLLAILIKASQSPNIIRFYGLLEIDGDKVMVLEWAQLESLKEIYENEKKKQ